MNETNTKETAVRATGVHVAYGSSTILNGVDLTAPAGRVYGLLGRNGTGKSTLVRCLLGQERPSRGRTELLGLDAWNHRAALMARVGVVPESPQVPPNADANELLAMGQRLYKVWERDAAIQRLERFGVSRSVPFGRLSKGQQKQVELALALAQKPELLILDDPSLGLDSVAKRVLYEELLEHLGQDGVTVFLTSHDLDAVERLAETVAILHQGRLIVEEPLESLKARFRRFSLRQGETVPAETPIVATRSGAWGQEAIAGYPSPEQPLVGDETSSSMNLEEIFDALVGPKAEGVQT